MDSDQERKVISWIAWVNLISSFPIFVILYFILPAPYGKFLPPNNNKKKKKKNDDEPTQQQQQQQQQQGFFQQEKIQWLYGPRFPAKWSWMVFESPNLIWALVCGWTSIMTMTTTTTTTTTQWHTNNDNNENNNNNDILPNYILFIFFTLHYIQRGIYYPLCMSSHKSKPVPLLVIVSALLFCTGNG